jgi:Tol biopolymer transport system component
MKKTFALLFIALFVILSSGCGPGKMFGPTLTPTPTNTPIPTNTPTPTNTQTPTPTSTPTSTPTYTPTPTPIGGASGIIVFARNEIIDSDKKTYNLFLYNLSTGVEIRLTNSTSISTSFFSPSLSPNGEKIVFAKYGNDTGSELFSMDIDGKNIKKISPKPMYQGNLDVTSLLNDFQPAWSPDGTKIVFTSNRHLLSQYNTDYEIYIIDLSTFEITQLTNAYRYSQHPWFSPDGTKITFMSNRENNWNIYIMDVDGKNVKRITKGTGSNRFPKWSNNGNSIIFHSDRDGNLELYKYDLSDNSTSRLTTDPSENASASFSPDDNWIVFQSDTSGNFDLYVMNLQSGETIQITSNEADETVADWSR